MSTITKEPITHDLKIYPEHFSAVCTGVKRAELRKNDRDYRAGDTLHLMETPCGSCHATGEFINVTITHVADVGEWMPGYVLLSIALASLEAEAVAVTDDMAYAFHHALSDSSLGADDVEEIKAALRAAFANVAAPPAPASVPAAMEMDDDFDSAFEHGKAVGWNAYRAAMLQSFGNSEQLNSPVIPDGWKLVPIELTGDMTNAMSEAILDDLHNVDVWRSVLAAAPQQEVK
ncbi:DUF3850 domain-containing protein [Enterobacter cloacae]|uniref:DUF3850 domain-containing protein n=1 Tax=Enterobacter cloacae TaxID=550 RepID=UPI003314D96C